MINYISKVNVSNTLTLQLAQQLTHHFGGENVHVEEGSLLDHYTFYVTPGIEYHVNDELKHLVVRHTDYETGEQLLKQLRYPEYETVKLIERFDTSQYSKYEMVFEEDILNMS